MKEDENGDQKGQIEKRRSGMQRIKRMRTRKMRKRLESGVA